MVKHRMEYGISWTEMKFCLDAKWYHIYIWVCVCVCVCVCIHIYVCVCLYIYIFQCNGHELGQTLGDGEGQRSLACCSPWGHEESDTIWWLNKYTCLCVCVCTHAQSFSRCLTFCNPLDCSLLGSSIHGISQVRILEWDTISYSRGSSPPKDRTCVSCISCTGRWILYHCATWEYIYVQSLSFVQLFATPWTVRSTPAPRSSTVSQNLLKFMSIESVMPSNHLILSCPLLLLLSIFPSIRVFAMSQLSTSGGQSIGASVSATFLSMNIQGWFPLGLTGLISLQSNLKSLLPHHNLKLSVLQCSALFMVQLLHPYTTTGKTIALTRQTLCYIIIIITSKEWWDSKTYEI